MFCPLINTSANDRRIRGYQSRVDAINALEPEIAVLSDEALKARTAEFRTQLANGNTLDDILVPAFATVREAAKRTRGQRHFDVQPIGGMVLHEAILPKSWPAKAGPASPAAILSSALDQLNHELRNCPRGY
jgi:preprotein translocase subunit SecA